MPGAEPHNNCRAAHAICWRREKDGALSKRGEEDECAIRSGGPPPTRRDQLNLIYNAGVTWQMHRG